MNPISSIAAKLKKAVGNALVRVAEKFKSALDAFDEVMTEGHYRTDPKSSWHYIFNPGKRNLPETSSAKTAKLMMNTSTSFGKRFLWGAGGAAILSSTKLILVGVGLAVVGGVIIGFEYSRAKKASKDIITEINFAGQRVQGRRGDLCRLHQAQTRIMNVVDQFKTGTSGSTSDSIAEIIKGVDEIAARVTVLDGGKFGASGKLYEFSEPSIKLVFDTDRERLDGTVGTVPATEISSEISSEFNKLSEKKIIDQLVAIEQSLPPHILAEVRKRVGDGQKIQTN